jgi:hypothetical protein
MLAPLALPALGMAVQVETVEVLLLTPRRRLQRADRVAAVETVALAVLGARQLRQQEMSNSAVELVQPAPALVVAVVVPPEQRATETTARVQPQVPQSLEAVQVEAAEVRVRAVLPLRRQVVAAVVPTRERALSQVAQVPSAR